MLTARTLGSLRSAGLALIVSLFAFAAAQPSEGNLRVALAISDSAALHPHVVTAKEDRGIVATIFNGLVRFAPGDMAAPFQPDLAESWSASEDSRVWTFNLRDDVMCHPWTNPVTGESHPAYQLTSEDVVYSYQSAADPAKSAYSGSYLGMTFEAVDDLTVRVTSEDPISEVLFLPLVANDSGGLVMCKQAAEDLGDDYQTHPVGTGPFIFQEYVPREGLVVTRNPDYFRDNARLESVSFIYMPSESSRKFALRNDEIDVISGATQDFVEEMRGYEGVIVDVYGPGQTVQLHLNMTKPPFDNLHVRRAFMECLDRDTTRATVGIDITENIYTLVPPYMAGGMTREQVEAREVEDSTSYIYGGGADAAREELAEAGFPDGVSLSATMTAREDYQSYVTNAQAQLAECGIDIAFQTVDHATYGSYRLGDAEPIVAYNVMRPTADVFLTQFFHSASIVSVGTNPSLNFSHIGAVDVDGDGEVDSVDELIEQARVETDVEEQVRLWQEAQLLANEWAVMWPGFGFNFVAARGENVEWGYELNSVLAGFPLINEETGFAED